jgi:hypothetical protein
LRFAFPAPGLRYTKAALLLFGLGALLGLAVVAAELSWPARLASGIMALALLLLPVALIADGRGMAGMRLRWSRPRAKARRIPASRRRRAPARRVRARR